MDEALDEIAISFVHATLEGILKLLERVTSVHYRIVSIDLRVCSSSAYLEEVTITTAVLYQDGGVRPVLGTGVVTRLNVHFDTNRRGCRLEEVAKGGLRLTGGRVGPVRKCCRVLIEGDEHSDSCRGVFAVQDDVGITQREGLPWPYAVESACMGLLLELGRASEIEDMHHKVLGFRCPDNTNERMMSGKRSVFTSTNPRLGG